MSEEVDVNKWPNDQDKPVVLVNKLRALGFYNHDIRKIIEAIETTCNECWDCDLEALKYGRCTCMMDE
jgi:hypothetical protein